MGEVNDGVPRLVDLVKDKIAEEFDDISVSGFGPPWLTSESAET